MIDDEDMLEELHRGPPQLSTKAVVLALILVWSPIIAWVIWLYR